MKNAKVDKQSEQIAKIKSIKAAILNNFSETGQLPTKRSPKGPLKTQYTYMEKFNNPKNSLYDIEMSEWLKSVGFESFAQDKITKTIKYRLYPSPTEEAVLLRQMELCRKIYNLLIEERRIASDAVKQLSTSNLNYIHDYKNKQLYPDAFSQDGWLAKQRAKNAELPIFKETSSSVRAQICAQVDQAYKDFFKNLKSGKQRRNGKHYSSPQFKRNGEYPSMVYNRPNGYRFSWNGQSKTCRIFGFPKFASGLRVNLMNTAPPESVRGQKITYDSGIFYLSLTIETTKKLPLSSRSASVGIDLGIARTVQLSNGDYLSLPEKLKTLYAKVKKLQRRMRRKEKGGPGKRQSNSYKKANARIAKIQKKIASTVKYHQAMWATEICRSHDLVVMEKLAVKNMTQSAKGTLDNPGKKVAQKSGLNRSILMTAPGQFILFMKNKANEFNIDIELINPAYTSQMCSACGYVHKDNRKTQDDFTCLSCGFTANADHNAALNILKKGVDNHENAQ